MAKKKSGSTALKKKNNKPLVIALVVVIIVSFVLYVFVPSQRVAPVNTAKSSQSYEESIKFQKEGELTFDSPSGDYKVKIDVELADNEAERIQGLMHRESMEELNGMFFVFPKEELQSFWMHNTLISLDIIFVNSKFEIVKIHKNTKILSDQSYPSNEPATYVVEVNAGFTDKYNIVEGDKIVWRKI